jgi:hypothetical protein
MSDRTSTPGGTSETSDGAESRPSRGAAFWSGVVLMAASFALYPALPAIALLPVSTQTKLAEGVAAWLASWTLFIVGGLLAGKEGVRFLRGLVSRARP